MFFKKVITYYHYNITTKLDRYADALCIINEHYTSDNSIVRTERIDKMVLSFYATRKEFKKMYKKLNKAYKIV